ncbi:MAG: type II toxin-antitoxin system VapC family toxin [Thermoanaerobaculia bacterium]|nr:type II toxin-antitoxin system VapC family toxin [Thermoanaerobaculia bacterium]
MHLLDTDTLTHLYVGHPRVVERLRTVEETLVGTTIITKIEMIRGRFDHLLKAGDAADLVKAQERLVQTERLLEAILVIAIDIPAARAFDRLREQPRLRKIGRADLLIAGIALANRAVLVTRNVRHFRLIPDLRVVNWVD